MAGGEPALQARRPESFENFVNLLAEGFRREGFDDVVGNFGLHRLNDVLLLGLRRNHEEGQVGEAGQQ